MEYYTDEKCQKKNEEMPSFYVKSVVAVLNNATIDNGKCFFDPVLFGIQAKCRVNALFLGSFKGPTAQFCSLELEVYSKLFYWDRCTWIQ